MNEANPVVKQRRSGGVTYYYVVGMVGKTEIIFAGSQNYFYWYILKELAEQDAAEISAGTAVGFRVDRVPSGLTFEEIERQETEEQTNA